MRDGSVGEGELRGPRFRRLFRDVYVSAGIEPDLVVRSLAAALLVAPAGGVLAGYSAAAVLGADCAPPGAPAEVLVPGHMRAQHGLRVGQGIVTKEDRRTARGCVVTSPLRTAWDLARRLELVEAIVAVDALAARGGFAPTALLDRAVTLPGARGCRRLPEVVSLADKRAESPMESRLRVIVAQGGLPPPQVQWPLVHDRRLIARFDLAYPHVKLAVEYDGRGHDDLLDRRRDIRTGRLGWYTARFTAVDLAQPAGVVAAVRALMAVRGTERDGSALEG